MARLGITRWLAGPALGLALIACSTPPEENGSQSGGGGGGGEVGQGAGATGGAGGSTVATGGGGGIAPNEADLRIVTINLQTFMTVGEPEARTAIVADAILALQPDFVALQEIAQSYDVANRGEALAELTGYAWHWEMAHDFVLYQEGTGYLTRWPVTWSDMVELPHGDFGGTTKRITVGAGIATPHGELAFFSSHATLDANESIKADQAAATLALMNVHASAAAFLGADMNAQPDTLAMRMLRGEASHGGVTGDLVDGWLATNPDDPGLTNPMPTPDKRIDYLYARGATPVACQLILAEPVDGLQASDHLGVMCDYALR